MGKWILMEDRKPPIYGVYTVKRRKPGNKTYNDTLLWNGSYFVTAKGSPTNAVNAWFDTAAEDKD